ncbi:nuclear transport factor 2 family protein [Mesonia aquimarina]|uniref:nuclear transport factor 2 family protein n=1 Tax=Mesonia aquimarina TaxID=1504967 RepID=UPI000EF60D07|nr:nuclear transport factor 2 family protein [Mesonia aquimarina]
MKKILFLLLFINFSFLSAQEDYANPRETVKVFFEAFHEQDTNTLRSLAFEEFQLKSISRDENGALKITVKNYSEFLKSIKEIPSNVVFEERLLNFEFNNDGKLANVWTPYEFYINGELSHCGVNNFQLVKIESDWKIISIVDTRSKENCQE